MATDMASGGIGMAKGGLAARAAPMATAGTAAAAARARAAVARATAAAAVIATAAAAPLWRLPTALRTLGRLATAQQTLSIGTGGAAARARQTVAGTLVAAR